MDLQRKLCDSLSANGELLEKSGNFSWIDVQFLQDAKHALINGRNTLKNSYIFSYHLDVDERDRMDVDGRSFHEHELFMENQRHLELAVEKLSRCIEYEVGKETSAFPSACSLNEYKLGIIKHTCLVEQRNRVLTDWLAGNLDLLR